MHKEKNIYLTCMSQKQYLTDNHRLQRHGWNLTFQSLISNDIPSIQIGLIIIILLCLNINDSISFLYILMCTLLFVSPVAQSQTGLWLHIKEFIINGYSTWYNFLSYNMTATLRLFSGITKALVLCVQQSSFLKMAS